jgi:hypothetical protein
MSQILENVTRDPETAAPPVWTPDPAEIRRRTAEIRRGWTPDERWKRAAVAARAQRHALRAWKAA